MTPSATQAGGKARLWTPAFVGLGAAELAYFTAAGLLIPLTPLFASGDLGADKLGVGITVGAFSVTALILRPIAGRAADQRGRRPLLIWGAFLAAIVIAAHIVVTDLVVLVGLRLLLGVAEAFFFVAGFAMVADLAPPGRAGEALSYNSLALYLGIAFGPGLGEWLVAVSGYPTAWLVGAGLCGVAGFIAVAMRESAELVTDPGPLRLLHPRAVLPSLGLFTGVAGMSGFLAFVALYASDLGMEGSGPVLLMFGVIVVGTRIAFARLPDRVPPYRLAAAALALVAIGLALMWLVPTVVGLYAGAALCALGIAFTTPAFFAAIVERVEPSERGTALGTTSLFIDLAFGGGPFLVGLVAGIASIPASFGVAALVVAAGAAGTAYAALGRRQLAAAS
jgi:MFS family permease